MFVFLRRPMLSNSLSLFSISFKPLQVSLQYNWQTSIGVDSEPSGTQLSSDPYSFCMCWTCNFLHILMQMILRKKCIIVFHSLELVENCFFSSWRSAIGGNSELFWLLLKALVSVEDTPLRYASLCSGREDKHPRMLLVLGWWNLFLLELSIYKPGFRCLHVLNWFCGPAFWSFWWVPKNISEFPHVLNTCVAISFLRLCGASYGQSPKKNHFPNKTSVRNTMVKFFCLETFHISIKHYRFM